MGPNLPMSAADVELTLLPLERDAAAAAHAAEAVLADAVIPIG